jgi:hypothetical protein
MFFIHILLLKIKNPLNTLINLIRHYNNLRKIYRNLNSKTKYKPRTVGDVVQVVEWLTYM